MTTPWQDLGQDQLEPIYNPRVAVSDAQFQLDEMARQSVQARAELSRQGLGESELRYGPGPLETLDLYRASGSGSERARPLVLFIHGGFWRALDKRDHSFVVPPLLSTGAVVANVNYDLCPAISLTAMVEQIVRAVRFCHVHAPQWEADPGRLVLIGHSAGAHLAARVLNQASDQLGLPADLVHGFAGISGIYEPEIVTRLTVNQQAQIDLATARFNDCLGRPPGGRARVALWAGGDEPAGWIDQTTRYAEVVSRAGLPSQSFTLAATNHFTVLQQSMLPDGMAFDVIRSLIAN